jgi:hypothetical protein
MNTSRSRRQHFAAIGNLHRRPATADGYAMWCKLRHIERDLRGAVDLFDLTEGGDDDLAAAVAKAEAAVKDVFGGRLPLGFFIDERCKYWLLKLTSSTKLPEGLQHSHNWEVVILAADYPNFGDSPFAFERR